jgi:hypothetical protein
MGIISNAGHARNPISSAPSPDIMILKVERDASVPDISGLNVPVCQLQMLTLLAGRYTNASKNMAVHVEPSLAVGHQESVSCTREIRY